LSLGGVLAEIKVKNNSIWPDSKEVARGSQEIEEVVIRHCRVMIYVLVYFSQPFESLIYEDPFDSKLRPSTAPERLLKASLLMVLNTLRSERLFCERLDYNLLFRWFLDLEFVHRFASERGLH
jgi:hypothetical protein